MGEKIEMEKVRPVKWSSRKDFIYPFILQQPIDTYMCLLCHCTMISHDFLLRHFFTKNHAERVRQIGCLITPLEDNRYYCIHCQKIIIDSTEVSDHFIEIEKISKINHFRKLRLSIQSSPVSWALHTKFVRPYILRHDNGEYGKYNCLVCGFVIMNDKSLKDHVNDTYHRDCVMYHGWHILPLEDNTYYCSTCDRSIIYYTAVYAHFLGRNHRQKLSYKATLNFPIPRPIEWSSREFFACPFVMRDNNGRYFCVACDICLTNDEDFYVHIKGRRHTEFLQIGGRLIYPLEYNYYYCSSCNTFIPRLYDMIDHHKHVRRTLNEINYKMDWSKPIDWNSSENFACPYISHENVEEYYCLVCNCDIVGYKNLRSHQDGKIHVETVKKDGRYISALADDSCYCSCCDCVIPEYRKVYDHIQRENHNLLCELDQRYKNTEKKESSNYPDSKLAEIDLNSNVDEENSSSKLAELDLNSNATSCKDDESGKETVILEQEDDIGQHSQKTETDGCNDVSINCPISKHADASSTNSNASNETKVDSPNWEDSGFDEILPNKNANPTIKRTIDNREISNLLNLYEDIYDLKDRVREINNAKELCFLTDLSEYYCLICGQIISTKVEEYVKHVDESNHHEELEKLTIHHVEFELKPDEFNQYRLTQQYMISLSKVLIRCLVCNEEINHFGKTLEDHVNREQHKIQWEEMREKVTQNFETIAKRMQCDWHKICRHRCEPCSITFDTEIEIALHLQSSKHISCLEYTEHAATELIYDFCEICALWWIGYRSTYATHCKSSEHKSFMQRGSYIASELPESARYFLSTSRMQLEEIVDYLDDIFAREEIDCKMLIKYLEATVKSKFSDSNVCSFGSRESSLLFTDRRIEIYLGCGRIYNGKFCSDYEILHFMQIVYRSLKEDLQTWEPKELLTSSHSPVIRTRHRETGISCEIFFENGLVGDCISLIKFFNQIFPQGQKLFLFLRQWLTRCDLSGHRLVSSYALYWSVIFFLQKDLKFFRVISLLAMREPSKIIDELSGSDSDTFIRNEIKSSCTMKELLIGFFKFYLKFDFRYDVACPIIGDFVKKRLFGDPKELPKEMESYIDYIEHSDNPEPFPIECAMCIQDPIAPQHNLTKAVSKADLLRFRACCAQSLYLLYSS